MKINYYQIDRRDENGKLEGYDMVKSININTALQEYLGADYVDYKITQNYINAKLVITARCPHETSGYLEISKRD